MLCPKCNHEVADGAKFCSNCGAKMERSSIEIDQDIGTLKGSATGAVIGEGAATQGISASIGQKVDTVESGGAVVGSIMGSKDSHIHVGGEQRYGDTVGGDKVQGDKVGGDKITMGDVSGTGIAIGRGASASVTQGISGDEMAALFAPVLNAIQSAPGEEQEAAQQKLQELETEAAKGEKADDPRMAGLIDDLVGLVPGAVGAVVSVFASPILGGIAGPVTNFVLQRIGSL
jgi:hypothetical protein